MKTKFDIMIIEIISNVKSLAAEIFIQYNDFNFWYEDTINEISYIDDCNISFRLNWFAYTSY